MGLAASVCHGWVALSANVGLRLNQRISFTPLLCAICRVGLRLIRTIFAATRLNQYRIRNADEAPFFLQCASAVFSRLLCPIEHPQFSSTLPPSACFGPELAPQPSFQPLLKRDCSSRTFIALQGCLDFAALRHRAQAVLRSPNAKCS